MANLDTKIQGLPIKIWAIVVAAGLGIGIYVNRRSQSNRSSGEDIGANVPIAVSRGAPGYIPQSSDSDHQSSSGGGSSSGGSSSSSPDYSGYYYVDSNYCLTDYYGNYVCPSSSGSYLYMSSKGVSSDLGYKPKTGWYKIGDKPDQDTSSGGSSSGGSDSSGSNIDPNQLYWIHNDESAEDNFGNRAYPIFGQYPWFSYYGVVAYSPTELAPGRYYIGQKPPQFGVFSGGEESSDAANAYLMYGSDWAQSDENKAYGTSGIYRINSDYSVDADNGSHYDVSSATGGVWLDKDYNPRYGGINVWYQPGTYAVGQQPPKATGGSNNANSSYYTNYTDTTNYGAGPNYGWLAWLFNPPQHGSHPYDSGGSDSAYPGVDSQTDCSSTYKGRLKGSIDEWLTGGQRHKSGKRGEMERRNAVAYAIAGGGTRGKMILWYTDIGLGDPNSVQQSNRKIVNQTRRASGLRVLTNSEFDQMAAQMQELIPDPGKGRPNLIPYADALFNRWNLPYQCGR